VCARAGSSDVISFLIFQFVRILCEGLMFQIFNKLKGLLSISERKRALLVFLLMLGTAFLEMVGVASIMPFVAVLSDPQAVQKYEYLKYAYEFLGFSSVKSFLILLGFFVLFLFVFSLGLKAFTTYAVLRFSNMRAHTFSYRLLQGYLYKSYSFFLSRNTAELSKRIFSEVGEVINGALIPAMKVVSGGLVAIMISLLLLIVEPVLTVVVGVVLGGAFVAVYISTRGLLRRLGERRVYTNERRFVLATEALNGIKELKLMGREGSYLERFSIVSKSFAKDVTISKAIGDLPHFAIQAIAFGGVLILVLYLMGVHGGLQGALPIIALYAFAGYRLLPAFQEIFKNITQLRFYDAALDSLADDLEALPEGRCLQGASVSSNKLSGDICLDGIRFSYSGSEKESLSDISISIPKGSSAAFVGSTGAGKSTLVDVILGLIKPSSGTLSVGDQVVHSARLRDWQSNIGYVPQNIFLADTSVAENIAFGIPIDEIDMAAVERAAKAAHIHDFIVGDLPQGYQSSVGERGIRLSGGQRQRIGIARALYHDPDVVVFDEATSALDNATESSVMEAINELRGQKTILLIAHRLSTVERCDTIFMLEQGKVCASGSYSELMSGSQQFARLASGNY
jgi:ABC-type bacteriocin/lantibiotic exporter with double-glycine peptidase domain